MSYGATVLQIMIASPGDVTDERNIVRDVIYEWNSIHSTTKKVVLMPIGWETHSVPEVGDRPQSIINKQLLESCDLLVAILWTRIGSPTGEFVSGTVEEIETHVRSGKPAMLYFSSVKADLEKVDLEQWEHLKSFKQKYRKIALVEMFDSLDEFKAKFNRQLAKKINEDHYINRITSNTGGTAPSLQSEPRQPAMSLSEEAVQLLLSAVQDPSGLVLRHDSSNGTILLSNKQQFGVEKDPRLGATWKAALSELVNSDLLAPKGNKGVAFEVTSRGYRLADEIRSEEKKGYPFVAPVFKKI